MLQEGREVVIVAAGRAGVNATSAAGYRVVGDLAVTDRIMHDAFWAGVCPGLSDQMLNCVGRTIPGAVGGQG